MQFTLPLLLLIPAAVAVAFPPPAGPYQVGITQHVFNHTTPNDPVAPQNASSKLLVTIYYPTAVIPANTTYYLDPTTADLWGSALQFPNGSLSSLTVWHQWQAPTLDDSTHLPTVILSPGGGVNAIMYNTLSSQLASEGYTVVAVDHPGEVPYLQLPDGDGVYGIDITASWNASLQRAVYDMRVSDTLAIVRQLWSPFVASTGTPFNTTHYLVLGHSVGGAVAAGTAAVEPSILGGINLDGLFFDLPDVKKPFYMIAGAEHTPAIDPTWSPFSQNQTGWWEWLNVTGSDHLDFSDIGDWVDLQGLRNKTITPQLGVIWAPRMNYIVNTLVSGFFDFVLGKSVATEVPDTAFPEVVYINGSSGIA